MSFLRFAARHLVLLACVLAPIAARAQWLPIVVEAQPLVGEVRGRGDRVPQANIDVLVDDGSRAITTDAQGRFVLEGLPVGRHIVHFRGTDIAPADEEVW